MALKDKTFYRDRIDGLELKYCRSLGLMFARMLSNAQHAFHICRLRSNLASLRICHVAVLSLMLSLFNDRGWIGPVSYGGQVGGE